jgi:predicted DNA-binding transcriptional regulator YafY
VTLIYQWTESGASVHAIVRMFSVSRIDDVRMMIAEIEDELKENETDDDQDWDVEGKLVRLADLKDELEELEKSS